MFNPKVELCRMAFAKEIKKHTENYRYFLNRESITTSSGFARNEVYNPKSPLYVDESSLFPTLEELLK